MFTVNTGKGQVDQEIKKQWTAALRSDQYTQTTGALRNGEGFCCMGVLCDIAVKAEIIDEPDKTGDADGPARHIWYSYDNNSDCLPGSVVEWAGLMNRNPDLPYESNMMNSRWYNRGSVSLGELNDNGFTFRQIADLIDKNF